MISVRPGSLGHRVLSHVVALPGELTAEDIADLLWPEPRHEGPFTAASYTAHRARLAEHRSPEAHSDRVGRVSQVLHRLQQQGLVERTSGVQVAPWHEERVARLGELQALELARVEPDEDTERSRDLGAHLRVVTRVRACPGSVRELLAEGGGWAREAYQDLGAWGVLITPTRRRPTAAGIAVVEGTCAQPG